MMRFPLHPVSVLFALVGWAAATPGMAAGEAARRWFVEQGYAPPDAGRVVACHGYGCSRRLSVMLDTSIIPRAAVLLKASKSAAAERQAVGEIVRAYTAQLARELGGRPDIPGSPPQMSGQHGQMDCIDETANTTSLLVELESRGLLAHHRVERPQSRGLFFDGRYPHVTAVIAETKSGVEWAVDPWRQAPGQKPDILPLSQWRQDS